MKITGISCEQFAGIRDKNITLADGLNVICGKNESGKSTLVNLISRTLFQNARLDGRSDKDFINGFFPSRKRGSSISGDFADGRLRIETENGTYILSKEWGAEPSCKLSTPDGVIRDARQIAGILRDILIYGEGVYTDMLLTTQKNSGPALQALLDASQKTDAKQELTAAVTMAFAESGGISVDAIGQAIDDKIKDLSGQHWDTERSLPVRKAGGGRWSSGLGEVLKAYYALDDAQSVLDNIAKYEAAADRAAADYALRDSEAREAEEAFNRFSAFAGKLTAQSERRKTAVRLRADIAKYNDILAKWPSLEDRLAKAKLLRDEKAARELIDKYLAAKKLSDELAVLDKAAAEAPCPPAAEISGVRQAQARIAALENRLCGINLNAAVTMLGGHTVELRSLRTGEPVDISSGSAVITEAVSIEVPGVMTLRLSPANVDVAAVKAQLDEAKEAAGAVLSRYGAAGCGELEALSGKASELKRNADNVRVRLDMLLGGESFAELEAAVRRIGIAARSADEISKDIFAVCGNADAAGFIASGTAVTGGYAADYGSIGLLKTKAAEAADELARVSASIEESGSIPAEFASIADPEAHLAALRRGLDAKRRLREDALTGKVSAASMLESYRDSLSVDPAGELEKAKQRFDAQKELLGHWLHIREIFQAQRAALSQSPMHDISERFAHYLGLISGGRVSSEFPDENKLAMQIYSNDRLLDYGKLSEGTKETVSLAFRLAALDHLFPDGGGLAVFDDPFTDMDDERAARSCALIREFASRHQVIFLTCREEYLGALGGNIIYMDS